MQVTTDFSANGFDSYGNKKDVDTYMVSTTFGSDEGRHIFTYLNVLLTYIVPHDLAIGMHTTRSSTVALPSLAMQEKKMKTYDKSRPLSNSIVIRIEYTQFSQFYWLNSCFRIAARCAPVEWIDYRTNPWGSYSHKIINISTTSQIITIYTNLFLEWLFF